MGGNWPNAKSACRTTRTTNELGSSNATWGTHGEFHSTKSNDNGHGDGTKSNVPSPIWWDATCNGAAGFINAKLGRNCQWVGTSTWCIWFPKWIWWDATCNGSAGLINAQLGRNCQWVGTSTWC